MIFKNIWIILSSLLVVGSLNAQNIEISSSNDWVIIHAKATDRKTDRPALGIRTYLSIPGTSFHLVSDVSDSNGVVKFLLKQPSPNTVFIFSQESPEVTIEKTTPFTSSYDLKHIEENSISHDDSLPFYGTPDKRYFLDDYTRFSTIEEILIEYVPEIKLKKQKEGFLFEVLNSPYKTFFDKTPLVLLDGVPVFDLNKLMALNPLNLRKLEVVPRKYYYGSLVCYGIVSFTTYDGKMGGYQLPANALVTEFDK